MRTLGARGSCASTAARRRFISEMQVARRPPASMDSSVPLSHNLSLSKEGSAREVVVERRWSWSRVTESEEFVGRMSLVSRFPQYLRL